MWGLLVYPHLLTILKDNIMLQLKLRELGTNKAGTKLYIEDSTGVFGPDNEGGYGGGNPERTDIALVLVSVFKGISVDKNAEIAPYDPLSVDSFTIELSQDGWLQTTLFSVPKYDAGASYEEGDIVYDDGLRKYIDGEFEDIEKEDLLDTDLIRYEYNRLIPIKIVNKLSEINKAIIFSDDDDVYVNWQQRYDIIYGHLSGANEYFCAKNYYEAQRIIETAEDYYKTFC